MNTQTMWSLAAAAAATLAGAPSATAQSVPSGFTVTNLAPGGLPDGAAAVAQAPDGRLYIAQQIGTIRVWDPASGIQPAAFYTFSVELSGERGLIGIAVDPNWSSNHFIYAHYSRSGANAPIIKRITASASNPSTVVPGSEVTLIDLGSYPSGNNWHVGGGIRFGGDGKLYLGLGDNGDSTRSQTLDTIFGKLLRINPDPASPIPSDNPTSFPGIAGSPTGANRIIYAVGLRNPFTFAFHPVTGRLFIDDVGENAWEEINDGVAGANYGWPATEGDFAQAGFPSYTRPFYAYNHSAGPCIVGGVFYHPAEHSYPAAYSEDYFFGDYIGGWVKRIDPSTRAVTDFATGMSALIGMVVDPQGRLILVSDGNLSRIEYTATLAPAILEQPVAVSVTAGNTAQFTVYASGNRALSYQWRFNGAAISDGGQVSGATTPKLTIAAVDCADDGAYDVVVSNPAGFIESTKVMLNGEPACYINCDCSATTPTVNVSDFTCFLQRYAAHDPWANCDQSLTAPVLNVADFTCFLQKYATGCP